MGLTPETIEFLEKLPELDRHIIKTIADGIFIPAYDDIPDYLKKTEEAVACIGMRPEYNLYPYGILQGERFSKVCKEAKEILYIRRTEEIDKNYTRYDCKRIAEDMFFHIKERFETDGAIMALSFLHYPYYHDYKVKDSCIVSINSEYACEFNHDKLGPGIVLSSVMKTKDLPNADSLQDFYDLNIAKITAKNLINSWAKTYGYRNTKLNIYKEIPKARTVA